jgi:hypothetical protein
LRQAPLSRDELNALTTSAAFRGLEFNFERCNALKVG